MGWVKKSAVNLVRDVSDWSIESGEWVRVADGRVMWLWGLPVLRVDGLLRLDGVARCDDV